MRIYEVLEADHRSFWDTSVALVMRHCNTVLVRYQTQEIIHRNRAATRLIDVMKQCAACRKR